jgi:hypothetical protein
MSVRSNDSSGRLGLLQIFSVTFSLQLRKTSRIQSTTSIGSSISSEPAELVSIREFMSEHEASGVV